MQLPYTARVASQKRNFGRVRILMGQGRVPRRRMRLLQIPPPWVAGDQRALQVQPFCSSEISVISFNFASVAS
jgi:hypothetical protein